MPAYDFRCEPCDSVFEITRSVSDRSNVLCPQCGTAAKRVFTPVGVHFKGSGFHNTDYRDVSGSAGSTDAPPPCSESCDGCPSAATGDD